MFLALKKRELKFLQARGVGIVAPVYRRETAGGGGGGGDAEGGETKDWG